MADPSWMTRAHNEMGVCEVDGSASNPRIIEYFRACGKSADWVRDESTPWCGGFIGWVMHQDGHVLPSEPLRARAWLGWGTALTEPRPGCVVIITRGSDPASGHVGLFRQWSDDRSKIYLLGGNQGDEVSIAAFNADRVLGFRWPPNAAKTVPQTDDAVLSEVSAASKVGVAVAATGSASVLPIPPAEHLAWLGTWKDALMQISDFVGFAAQHWMIVAGSLTAWTAYRIWSLRKMEILSGAFWKG